MGKGFEQGEVDPVMKAKIALDSARGGDFSQFSWVTSLIHPEKLGTSSQFLHNLNLEPEEYRRLYEQYLELKGSLPKDTEVK